MIEISTWLSDPSWITHNEEIISQDIAYMYIPLVFPQWSLLNLCDNIYFYILELCRMRTTYPTLENHIVQKLQEQIRKRSNHPRIAFE